MAAGAQAQDCSVMALPDRRMTICQQSPYDAQTGTFLEALRETFAPVQVGGPEVLADHVGWHALWSGTTSLDVWRHHPVLSVVWGVDI